MFVQFWINSTCDVWKFCQIGLAPAAHPILAKFPNITRTINPKLYSHSHDYLYKLRFQKKLIVQNTNIRVLPPPPPNYRSSGAPVLDKLFYISNVLNITKGSVTYRFCPEKRHMARPLRHYLSCRL